MKLTDFSALTIDCYGTLIDWETGIAAALQPWAMRHGLASDHQDLLAGFGRHEHAHQSRQPAPLYPNVLAGVLHDTGAELGLEVTDQEAEAFGASVKDWPAFPDSAEALGYLKQHYKLVIVSNVDRASFAHSHERLGVEFDLIVTAQDVGSYKPAPAHFEAALAWLSDHGVPKEKILHTAQSLFHDHVPAKQRFAMASIWINRQAGAAWYLRPLGLDWTPPAALDVTPDWEVPSMAAMVELHKQHLGE